MQMGKGVSAKGRPFDQSGGEKKGRGDVSAPAGSFYREEGNEVTVTKRGEAKKGLLGR